MEGSAAGEGAHRVGFGSFHGEVQRSDPRARPGGVDGADVDAVLDAASRSKSGVNDVSVRVVALETISLPSSLANQIAYEPVAVVAGAGEGVRQSDDLTASVPVVSCSPIEPGICSEDFVDEREFQ